VEPGWLQRNFLFGELSDMLPFSDIVAGYASNKADILEGSSGTYTLRSGPGLADDGSEAP
jgi:hypothetical protein